jgi:hypothetical protein
LREHASPGCDRIDQILGRKLSNFSNRLSSPISRRDGHVADPGPVLPQLTPERALAELVKLASTSIASEMHEAHRQRVLGDNRTSNRPETTMKIASAAVF